jgi:hypothetical protein
MTYSSKHRTTRGRFFSRRRWCRYQAATGSYKAAALLVPVLRLSVYLSGDVITSVRRRIHSRYLCERLVSVRLRSRDARIFANHETDAPHDDGRWRCRWSPFRHPKMQCMHAAQENAYCVRCTKRVEPRTKVAQRTATPWITSLYPRVPYSISLHKQWPFITSRLLNYFSRPVKEGMPS